MNKKEITRRAACASALAASNLLLASASAQQAAPGQPRAANRPRAVVSPDVAADGRITFRISAPKAAQVTLLGEWPDGARTPMTKDADGVWSVAVGPLRSDMWCYAFEVDGVKTLDPSNMFLRRDTYRVDNLVFAPGAAASLYSVNEVPHGTVSAVWYPSPSLKQTRRMHVYTPPGYETSRERYPVVYLLHGMGGDEAEWVISGRAAQILDNLIAQKQAKPMIVVMPNGHSSQEAAPDYIPVARPAQVGGGPSEGMTFPESVIPDIVPFVEKNYRVVANRENRAVMGLSMGGAHALYAGLRNLDQFAWVAGFSGAYVMYGSGGGRAGQPGASQYVETFNKIFPKLDASANARLRLLYLTCGQDDFLLEVNRQLKTWLKAKDVRFVEVETPGYAHVWAYWRKNLAEVAPRLFK